MCALPVSDRPTGQYRRSVQNAQIRKRLAVEPVAFIRHALLLLGAFCIAYNAANALHELGHVTCLKFTGGTLNHVYVQPFGLNWTTWSKNEAPVFMPWSGVLLGTLFAILISGASLLIRSVWASPFHFLGVVAPTLNGLYIIFGVWAGVSNGADIIQKGFSEAFVTLIGLVLIGIGLFWAIGVQALLGFTLSDSLLRRMGVFLAAIVPYLLVLLIHVATVPQSHVLPDDLLQSADELATPRMSSLGIEVELAGNEPFKRHFGTWFSYASGGTFVAIVFGALMHVLRNQGEKIMTYSPKPVSRWQAGIIFSVGVLAVLVLEWYAPQVVS